MLFACRRDRLATLLAACLLPSAFCLLPTARAYGQVPYATINREAITYNGPGRDAGHDIAGPEFRLGLLAPLSGPRAAEGQELLRAAQMAIEEENAAAPPGGSPFAIVARDESGPWGKASSEVVHLVFDDQALALITSTDGAAAHLAEQVGNKVGVPILTLASDTTTTEINLPWIFRLGATDAAQAQSFARDIYSERGLHRVVLLAQDDHDGRAGGEEFARAAQALNMPAPIQISVGADMSSDNRGDLPFRPAARGESPRQAELMGVPPDAEAIVIWADPTTAHDLLVEVREKLPLAPVYLCRKATGGDWRVLAAPRCRACGDEEGDLWTTQAPGAQSASHAVFVQHYRQRYAAEPGIAAAQAYDAARVLATSIRRSGPNRARLRDALAAVTAFPGASGVLTFDRAGNDTSQITLLKIE